MRSILRSPRLWLACASLALASSLPVVADRQIGERGLPDPLAAGWKGKSVCDLLHEDQRQRVLRCSFAPGEGHERHFHPPHFGYVLSGSRMRITDSSGDREVDIRTGGTWVSEGVDWHEVENVGETTGIYLLFEAKQQASEPAEAPRPSASE